MVVEERHKALLFGLVAGYYEVLKNDAATIRTVIWLQTYRHRIFEQFGVSVRSMCAHEELMWTQRALERWFEEERFDLPTDDDA